MLKELYKSLNITDLIIIVTDAEMGLICAISEVFTTDTRYLLCIWHINKNVTGQCKKWFNTTEDWKAFNAM